MSQIIDGKCWKCTRCNWVGCYSAEDIATMSFGGPTECQNAYHESLVEISQAEGWEALADEASLEVRRAARAMRDAKSAMISAERNAAHFRSLSDQGAP